MSLIAANHLSRSYGPKDIFLDLSFSVAKGSRLALVGPNGIGKTTLLRILVGEEEPSGGQVTRPRKLNLGYLPQEAEFKFHGTLRQSCQAVFSELQALQEELHHLEDLMRDPAEAEQVLKRYGRLQQDFERRGGYSYLTRIDQVLAGLGFTMAEYDLPLEHLSGGQRTRAFLAHLLLSDPDLLLLDEPTNHLDIAAVEWLEGYLNHWNGAALLVSHDRYFLDRVCNGILEMSQAGLEIYTGNYSSYLQQRQARANRRQEVFETEKERLLKEIDYIKRNISGQNTLQAKGRLKRLSRLVQAVEQAGFESVMNRKWIEISDDVSIAVSPFGVEEAERRVRALKSPVRQFPRLTFILDAKQRSGELVLRTTQLKIGFPGKLLFSAPDIVLRRGECAALIGPNGAGKTTFLKTILGQIEPLVGEIVLGASLQVGYFAQAHEGLKAENTLMQEIESLVPSWLPGQVRDYLAKYLFFGDDAFKRVGVLSGGERGRLALAKLALQDTNLLLLDEPTNHLDIPSQEVLQAVLDDYGGTVLLVTHDRYLIDALGTQIWEIEPDETSLRVFNGSYTMMKEERERLVALRAGESGGGVKNPAKSPHSIPTMEGRSSVSKETAKAEHRRIAKLQALEKKISVLESHLAELGRRLEKPPDDPAEVARMGEEYARVQQDMDQKLKEWEHLQA